MIVDSGGYVVQEWNSVRIGLTRSRCYGQCPDYEVVTLSIEGKAKSVVDYVGEQSGTPRAVRDLENAIDRVANTAQWIRGSAKEPPPGPPR